MKNTQQILLLTLTGALLLPISAFAQTTPWQIEGQIGLQQRITHSQYTDDYISPALALAAYYPIDEAWKIRGVLQAGMLSYKQTAFESKNRQSGYGNFHLDMMFDFIPFLKKTEYTKLLTCEPYLGVGYWGGRYGYDRTGLHALSIHTGIHASLSIKERYSLTSELGFNFIPKEEIIPSEFRQDAQLFFALGIQYRFGSERIKKKQPEIIRIDTIRIIEEKIKEVRYPVLQTSTAQISPFIISSIPFQFKSLFLKKDAPELQNAILFLQANPNANLQIVGKKYGRKVDNWHNERRCNLVKACLEDHYKIAPERIEILFYSDQLPADYGDRYIYLVPYFSE